MQITIKERIFGGFDFYLFEERGDRISIVQPVTLIAKTEKCAEGSSPNDVKPTFSITDSAITGEFRSSLGEALKKLNLYDESKLARSEGLLDGKDQHIVYLESTVDKLLNMISGRSFIK